MGWKNDDIEKRIKEGDNKSGKNPRIIPKQERIGLISKAVQIGLIRKFKHPAGFTIILQNEEDKTSEWEQLERFTNNRRNTIVNLKLSKEMLENAVKKTK